MKTPMQEFIQDLKTRDVTIPIDLEYYLEKEKQCICTAYRNGIFNHVTVYSVEDSINEAKQYYTDLTNQ